MGTPISCTIRTVKYADAITLTYNTSIDKRVYKFVVAVTFKPTMSDDAMKLMSWSINNQKWLLKNEYDYKYQKSSPRVSRVRKTYYFKNEREAIMFGLWCPRTL